MRQRATIKAPPQTDDRFDILPQAVVGMTKQTKIEARVICRRTKKRIPSCVMKPRKPSKNKAMSKPSSEKKPGTKSNACTAPGTRLQGTCTAGRFFLPCLPRPRHGGASTALRPAAVRTPQDVGVPRNQKQKYRATHNMETLQSKWCEHRREELFIMPGGNNTCLFQLDGRMMRCTEHFK